MKSIKQILWAVKCQFGSIDKKQKILKRMSQKVSGYKFGWSNIKTLGNSKIVKSSYLWIVIVPILAKTLDKLNEVITINVFGAQISLNFTLPFTWKIFFFASLFFALGQLIFNIYCPPIIKNFQSFTDFQKHGLTCLDIKHAFLVTTHFMDNIDNPYYEMEASDELKNFYKAATGKRFSMLTEEDRAFFIKPSDIPTQNVDRIIALVVAKAKEPDLFSFVKARSEGSNYKKLLLSSISFLLGITLLLINLIENIWAVINL